MSRLAWCVLVNPYLISISFSNLSKHFKATATSCLGSFSLAAQRGTGYADPLTASVAGTHVRPSPSVAAVEAGSEQDLSWDPEAVKVILGGVWGAAMGGEMGAERGHRQCLPVFHCSGWQHMGEEGADGCTAAVRL